MPVAASCAGAVGLDFSDGLGFSDGSGWLRKVTVGVAAVIVPLLGVRLTRVQPAISGSLRVQATLPRIFGAVRDDWVAPTGTVSVSWRFALGSLQARRKVNVTGTADGAVICFVSWPV